MKTSVYKLQQMLSGQADKCNNMPPDLSLKSDQIVAAIKAFYFILCALL